MVFGWFPWFFMVFGWFPWFFKVSRWIFIVINGPKLVETELSAAGAKWDVKNTQKVLTSSVSWPHDPAKPCRLWPSDDDDDDAGRDRDVNDARNANFGDPALVWHVLWDPTKMREKVDNDRAENQDDDHRVHRPPDQAIILSCYPLCDYSANMRSQ